MTWPILTNVRLRTLSNTAGGDPATAQRQLEWNRAAADAVWRPMEVNSATAPAFGTAGATTTTGTTAPTVAYPTGIVKGDLLVLYAGNRPNASTFTLPSGWTLQATATGGAGAEAADTGVVRGTVWTKEADGTETGNLTLALTGGLSVGAKILRYTKGPGHVWSVAIATGADNSAGTSWSATAGSDPGVIAGDILLICSCSSTDTATVTVPVVTQTGVTTGAATVRDTTAVGTGNDQRVIIVEFPVTAGPGTAAPVYTMTMSAATAAGISLFLRIRQVDAPVQLVDSANIVTGGATATTRQLVIPSGKIAGDFTPGDLSDDTNPLPTLDLPLNGFTEDEWCIQATATALTFEIYQFRVTLNGVAYTTYTQTPSWTIGVAVVPASLLIPSPLMRMVMVL